MWTLGYKEVKVRIPRSHCCESMSHNTAAYSHLSDKGREENTANYCFFFKENFNNLERAK